MNRVTHGHATGPLTWHGQVRAQAAKTFQAGDVALRRVAVRLCETLEEETGWRPRSVEFLLTFQPALGSADAPQDVYVARGADLVGEPKIDEAEAVRWVRVEEALEMIRTGEILGAATVIGVLHCCCGADAPELTA